LKDHSGAPSVRFVIDLPPAVVCPIPQIVDIEANNIPFHRLAKYAGSAKGLK
jgi:hypothetical protein